MKTRSLGRALRTLGLFACAFALAGEILSAQAALPPIGVPLPKPPDVRTPLVLSAVNDPVSGRGAFSFEGREVPPVIRVSPGQKLRITYLNRMRASSGEVCVDGPCMNMSNLHFHGLHVSPESPQDDVISMMAMPGESLRYTVDIPLNQPSGLYWYHTHPHGESYQQDLDGMSGAIVVEGIERYVPELRGLKEQILILRDAELHQGDEASKRLTAAVDISQTTCGEATGDPGRIFTVNGAVRPKIAIAPGEKQFWRIVNASPDLYADLMIDSEDMITVALDGMPLGYHNPDRPTESAQHVLLAPAGRLEVIVTGSTSGAKASLRSLCVNTGPDGDPNPAMVIADLDPAGRQDAPTRSKHGAADSQKAVYRHLSSQAVKDLEKRDAAFVVNFTEDKNGFYINNKKYQPSDDPMVTVKTGSYVHWQVVNRTHEVHPFHIHQVHFLVYGNDGTSISNPKWMDTVNLEPGQSLDLIMDFMDPIIRGISVFHCHLLKHEDKGMMAKIRFE
ncbi:multicopper oxidase family protein [Acidicapsa ligni]|uniref:multicopper oxidase family protein n=1 Tax=Acidicapsa ligni TaxID=542300 RepID=UPI0021DF7DA2|nr:multicopper oxidase family protein [Acidicapsa ligni]